MAASPSGTGKFDSLTRQHAIKIATSTSVEECSLAIGEMVGHDKILSAARMNNAVVLFLEKVGLANEVVERGVVIDGVFTSVFPLSTPSKKVILSNIPPFIKEHILAQTLSRYGKLVSPIRKIAMSSKSPLLKHIVSFRRYVYMIMKDNKDLDLTLNITVDDFNYAIFVTTRMMKCFGCGQSGHQVRACPDKSGNSANVKDLHTEVNAEKGHGSSRPTETHTNGEQAGAGGGQTPGEGVVPASEEPPPEQGAPVVPGGVVDAQSEPADNSQHSCVSVDNVDQSFDDDVGDESSQIEAEETVFKMPLKRGAVNNIHRPKGKRRSFSLPVTQRARVKLIVVSVALCA